VIREIKIGILLVFAALMLVSVASAGTLTGTIVSGSGDYFGIKLADGTRFTGWCAEENLNIYYDKYVFTTYDSRSSFPVGTQETWNKINYVMNHPVTAHGTATWHEIQAAVWYFMETSPPWNSGIDPVNMNIYTDLVNAANSPAGANFIPGPGDQYAVILKVSGYQAIFYMVTVPEIPAPEFPTVALPVAMIIGVVGVVQVIRNRKE